MTVQTNAAQHIFEAEVYLNDLDPKAVRVELYADGINGSDPIRLENSIEESTGFPARGFMFTALSSPARCSLIDDGWALLIDHQHQSLLLQGLLGISRVVREVFCHLNLPKRE